MTQQTYTKKVARQLACGKEKREEFTRQLASDIESALESGESWEAIQKRLGPPAEIAKEINESLGEEKVFYRKKKLLIGWLLLGTMTAALITGGIYFTVFSQNDPQKDNLSDNTVLNLTSEVIERFSSGDYEEIILLCDDKMKSLLSPERLQKIKEQTMPDAGAFLKTENGDPVRITEKDLSYTTVQSKAQYENQTMIFTLSWNDQQELCGFYLK